MILAAFVWPIVAAFWIFVLWMLWIVARSMREMSETFREIARILGNRS